MRSNSAAFGTGAAIGTLGGLIGLGGAEFRLPLLINLFKFRGLEAVILNKATSLIVVATALPFRARTVPFAEIGMHWPVILNLLAGSLVGAYAGASWATRLKSETLYKIIAVLLVLIAGVLLLAHDTAAATAPPLTGAYLVVAGVAAGFVIGVVASLLGVAGGEFLIPTLILLFGADVKLAGSLSLAVSLPTMLVGFARYSRDQSFSVPRVNWPFMLAMALGSTIGTFIGGLLLGIVPSSILLPGLAAILAISAVKVWRHEKAAALLRPLFIQNVTCWPQAAVGGCLLLRRCWRVSRHPSNGPKLTRMTQSGHGCLVHRCPLLRSDQVIRTFSILGWRSSAEVLSVFSSSL